MEDFFTFKYDPFGRRIYKSSSSGTSIYAYDGDTSAQNGAAEQLCLVYRNHQEIRKLGKFGQENQGAEDARRALAP